MAALLQTSTDGNPNSWSTIWANLTNTTKNFTLLQEYRDKGAARNAALATHDGILNILHIVIGVLGLIGNGFVILVIFNFRKMLNHVTNIYIISQSAVDGIASLMLIFSYIFDDADGRQLEGVADELLCRLWLTRGPLWGFMVSSSVNLIAVTIERYFAIVHPIWHKTSFTRTKALVSLPFIWMAGPIINAIYSLPSTKIEDGDCLVFWEWPNELVRRITGVCLVVFHYLIPIGIFAFCYGKIAHTLRGSTRLHPRPIVDGASTSTQSKFKAQAFINIIKTLSIVVVCFICCWGPNQIYFFLFNAGVVYPYIDFTSTFYHFSVVFTFINCCINPFVYITKYKQFQGGIRKLFGLQHPVVLNTPASATGMSIQRARALSIW